MSIQDGTTTSTSGPLVAQYRTVRSAVSTTERIAVLQLGLETTGIAVGTSLDPEMTIILGIGSRKTANDHFRHSPPTAGELETGIMVVEDEVARAQQILGGDAELFTVNASVRELALAAGQSTDSDIVLSVEQVERTFDRMAAVSLGRPAAREGLPEGNEFAATLLIVREFMHHLGFSRITVLT